MRRALTTTAAIVLLTATPLFAHRVDEYLQATTILVGRDRVQLEMRLAPGVAVAPAVLGAIDIDADGVISTVEQRTYVECVRRDVSLTVGGRQVPLRLMSSTFAAVPELRAGLGEIHLAFDADLPVGGQNRHLIFRNHHFDRIGAYLVNSLSPQDAAIRITSQNRDYRQSVYELSYAQVAAGAHLISFAALLRWALLLGGATIAVVGLLIAFWRRGLQAVSGQALPARLKTGNG